MRFMDLEFIIDILAGVLGFALISWILIKIFVKEPKNFWQWLIKNKYFHIISLTLTFILTILNSDVRDGFILSEFILFLPILILTYYFITFIGFMIYWNTHKGRKK